MKSLDDFCIKVASTQNVKILRETLKRIVFTRTEKSKVRISCCELITYKDELWIVPTDFIRHVRAEKLHTFTANKSVKTRTEKVASILVKWNLCTLEDSSIVDENSTQLFKVSAEVLSHNNPEVAIIKTYNFANVLNSIRKYLEA